MSNDPAKRREIEALDRMFADLKNASDMSRDQKISAFKAWIAITFDTPSASVIKQYTDNF